MPDAMGPVRRLIFDRRVPPGVEEEDVIGGGEIEPGSARLERDEEHRRPGVVLELADDGATIARRPVEAREPDPRALQVRLDQVAVGPIVMRNVSAMVARRGALDESLLGMSFLERLKSYTVERDRLVMVAK